MAGDPGYPGWQSPFTESTPDPKAVRTKKVRNGLIILAVIAAVAFAAGWNPPTKTVHSFTKASDYKPERESGCTNSGKGCHGSETSYTNFNVYHPDAKCTTCHDYQGVGCIPCHMPKEKECQLCHDGTMKLAPDVNRITDPYPRGHYRETTHTAIATKMTDEVKATPDGTAAAKCSDCHSADLRTAHTEVPANVGSEYGTTIGCGECHNDVRVNGLAEVLSKWKGRACEDCHKKDSKAPQHASDLIVGVQAKSPLDCGDTGAGCHNVNDLHVIHKDKPKTCAGTAEQGEKGCHVLGAQATKPDAITCGGPGTAACHRFYDNGTFSHKHDAETHSPTNTAPADDTSFHDTPCGGCHRMNPDGTSLVDEHVLPTSAKSTDARNVCVNCHNTPPSAVVVAAGWKLRNTTQSCSVCHGQRGLPAAHEGDLQTLHTNASVGCSNTGAGCHPTDDYTEVGTPTTSANIHKDCLRCHDWSESDGNVAYDPENTTCGQGRDCHAAPREYNPATQVHDGDAGLTNGQDAAYHQAGPVQANATWNDSASGVKTACSACHSMTLGTEHARPTSAIASGSNTLCVRCHNADATASEVVKANWSDEKSSEACAQCHTIGSSRPIHAQIAAEHVATELSPTGVPQPGACVTSGCHATLDLRVLHANSGCTISGCHQDSGNIFGSDITSCGGISGGVACHPGYSATSHFANHMADTTGTVDAVTYQVGENVGCFGCHVADLRIEHQNAMSAGTLEGGGANSCAICHADASGAGAFAGLSAVKNAIANHDKRCVACHASGSKNDGPSAVASAHKDTSSDNPLPPGKVWSDPAEDWKTAFTTVTGTGHNVLSPSVAGGGVLKRFPLTEFSIEGTTYVWALPPNSGATTWLNPAAFAPGATETTESIQHIQMTCDDCHQLPANMNGPHGSAVPIAIDPDYSQTEYANPTRTSSQFEATGTNRVVCFKCHPIYVGGVAGSTAPGGASLHARHVNHPDLPASSKHRYGETCVDCHVRIPHAWKRPRLLIRTVETTDGATPDTFPYILQGHDGLLGIRLRSFNPQSQLRSGSCVTGGCHPASSPTRHPRPSDVPTATYWP